MILRRGCVLRRFRKAVSVGADVTSDGRLFQRRHPATGNARSPTVDNRVRRIASCMDDDDRRRHSCCHRSLLIRWTGAVYIHRTVHSAESCVTALWSVERACRGLWCAAVLNVRPWNAQIHWWTRCRRRTDARWICLLPSATITTRVRTKSRISSIKFAGTTCDMVGGLLVLYLKTVQFHWLTFINCNCVVIDLFAVVQAL